MPLTEESQRQKVCGIADEIALISTIYLLNGENEKRRYRKIPQHTLLWSYLLSNYFSISLNVTNIFQTLIGKWASSPDKRYPNIILGMKYNSQFETAIMFGKIFNDSWRWNI